MRAARLATTPLDQREAAGESRDDGVGGAADVINLARYGGQQMHRADPSTGMSSSTSSLWLLASEPPEGRLGGDRDEPPS